MTLQAPLFPRAKSSGNGPVAPPLGERVLILDDSPAQRRLLCHLLAKWGYRPIDCATPQAALSAMADPELMLVICDWIMPEMSGPEFCRHLRAMGRESYAYVILLTSKTDRAAISEGLDAGADDFLTKPVYPHELQARLGAAVRVIASERELLRKNSELEDTLAELRGLYAALDRDLAGARELQMALLREDFVDHGAVSGSFLLRSSGHIGGDLVGYFPAGPDHLGFFALDVSGHGVSAAMITARLAAVLQSPSPEHHIALDVGAGGIFARPLPEVAQRLNDLMLDGRVIEQYFTFCMVLINPLTGCGRVLQAGHPHPMLRRASGEIQPIGCGGYPIGLLDHAEWRDEAFELRAGDRLMIYSDGWLECPDRAGAFLGEEGLRRWIAAEAGQAGPAFLSRLLARLEAHAGGPDFPDDISALVIDFQPTAKTG